MKKILRTTIPVVFYSLLLVFLGFYLASLDLGAMRRADINWWLVLSATAVLLGSRLCGAFTWVTILRSLGATGISLFGDLNFVYAKAWLGRYIPGKAPWILGKIYFASQHGISRNKLAVSSLLEAALQIVVQLAVALALFAADSRLNVLGPNTRIVLIVTVAVCLLAVLPPVFNRLLSFAYRVLRRGPFPVEHLASWPSVVSGGGLFTLVALLNGVALYLFAWAVYPDLAIDALFFIIGAGTVAGVAGMLAVFAPSGLGVRDGILIMLLSLIMPTEFAFVATVLSRLWDVIVDLAYLAFAAPFRSKKSSPL